MPSTRPRALFRIAVLALASALLASCGGGDGDGAKSAREEGCPKEIPLRPTFLPTGFTDELKEGAGREGAPKGVIAFHYQGQGDKVIDVFRGGQRTKIEQGERISVLGDTARYKAISGGFAAKVALGRGKCSRYQYEAFGISKDDFKKVLTGLRRVATQSDEGDE